MKADLAPLDPNVWFKVDGQTTMDWELLVGEFATADVLASAI
jgi:hypothetical protein